MVQDEIANILWKLVNSGTYSFYDEPLPVFYLLSKDRLAKDYSYAARELERELKEKSAECIANNKAVFDKLEEALTIIDLEIEGILEHLVEYFVAKYAERYSLDTDLMSSSVVELAYQLLQGCCGDLENIAIYNPFSGIGSYAVRHHKRCEQYNQERDVCRINGTPIPIDERIDFLYAGTEVNDTYRLIANVRIVASGESLSKFCVYSAYSSAEYSLEGFTGGWGWGALIAPPMDIRRKLREEGEGNTGDFYIELIENFVFKSPCFDRSLFILPDSILSSRRYLDIRRKLVESKKLEGVISLPSNIFSRSTEGFVIVVIDDNEREFVHFVDGGAVAFDSSTGMLDGDKIIDAYFSQTDWADVWSGIVLKEYISRNCSAAVSKENISEYGYNLHPTLYTYMLPEPEGLQTQVRLGDILEVVPSQIARVSQGLTISARDISDDDFSVFTSPQFVKSAINPNHKEYAGPALIVVSDHDTLKVCICESDDSFFLSPSQIAFRLKEGVATSLHYIALIFMDDVIRHRFESITSSASLRSATAIDAILNTRVNLDSLAEQEAKINILKAELDAFYESERQRLGIHTTSVDIAHMLKLPFSKIANTVAASISECDKESDMYQALISIQDNFEYIQRFINSYGADLSTRRMVLTEVGLNSFLSSYLSSWNSFGTFKIELDSQVSDEASVLMNVDLMRVLMDTILDNAYRHGFSKIESENNLGYITTSCVSMLDKEYICISIANNGKAFEKGFSLKDYVSRGKFSKSTGHTGIGGNHVYNIIKAHNGYLNITSNAKWNVIVELLIPAEYYSEEDAKNFVMYGNSANCL